MWATLIFAGTAVLFVGMTLATLWHLRWLRRLPGLETLTAEEGFRASGDDSIRCSVVVAARNEAARIEGTLRHLLAQPGVWTFCLLDFAANLSRAADCSKQPGKQDEDAVPSKT